MPCRWLVMTSPKPGRSRPFLSDPDNHLIAATLERNWEAALRRLRDLKARQPGEASPGPAADPDTLSTLTGDLDGTHCDDASPAATPASADCRHRSRRRRRRARRRAENPLAGWSALEISRAKPRTGEHGCATTEDASAVIRSMAGRWSDEHIVASLNRMRMPTGQGKTWTAHHVASVRRVHGTGGRRGRAHRQSQHAHCPCRFMVTVPP